MKRSVLYKFREFIEKGATSLTDTEALEAVALFPLWAVGTKYEVKSEGGVLIKPRIVYNDKLYRVEQTHTSQADWTPDITPALYTEVAPSGVIPVWKQPTGAQDAYSKGDKVHYPTADDPVYESLIDANVWSPNDYPQGWKVVE